MVKKEEKKEQKSKKRILRLVIALFAFLLPFIIAGLVIGLSYIIGGDEGEIFLDEVTEFFLNAGGLILIIILSLVVLNLLLMIFWKPARKVLPFIIYLALFLGTMIAYSVIDYVTGDDTERHVVTEAGYMVAYSHMEGAEL